MSESTYLAIIPARRGSKRLLNKNLLELAGKPLIAWTIEEALKSRYLTEVMVSTDSEEIARIAKKYGANVPFLRPQHISTNQASSVDVVKHAIDFYNEKGRTFDNIILLQPTSPLRKVEDINKAIEFQIKKKANSITAVCEMEHSPLWSNTLPENNSMEGFIRSEVVGKRSQELDTYYRLNGAIYITRISVFIKEGNFISNSKSYAYKMDKMNSIDIDDKIDFYLAEAFLNIR